MSLQCYPDEIQLTKLRHRVGSAVAATCRDHAGARRQSQSDSDRGPQKKRQTGLERF